jgi:hypothetical protein
MKITSLNPLGAYPMTIREKKESEGSKNATESAADRDADQGNQFTQQEHPHEKPDQKQIDAAVEAFQVDSQTQENGLKISVVGLGPGLKVVLKDLTGTIVRQFTGEEFLRIRKSQSKDSRNSGKILDQKL